MDPRVRQLYKNLLWMGKDYPQGYPYFRSKVHAAFQRQSQLSLAADMTQALAAGNHVLKELEAMYFLARYRTVKRNYERP